MSFLVVDCTINGDAVIANETDKLDTAVDKYNDIIKKALVASVILYDSRDDTIRRVFMHSEPICLVKSIELARKHTQYVGFHKKTGTKAPNGKIVESDLIKLIAGKVSNSEKPADKDYGPEYVIAPFHNLEGMSAGKTGAAVRVFGGLSGSFLGFVVGGPIGAAIGSIIGAISVGTGTSHLIKRITSSSLCIYCRGSGLEGNNYRCTKCEGYGYTKEQL